MIYTLGRIDVYEKYMASDPNAAKRKGGSVWETYDKVFAYLYMGTLHDDFKIYGVEADWNDDTEFEEGAEGWRALKRNAKLIKL